MLCCPNCFNDVGLRREIIPQRSSEDGNCPNCKSENMPLVEARSLADYFELLIGIYVEAEHGETLVSWLKRDWLLFTHENISIAQSKEILTEILDDGEIVRKTFDISEQCKTHNAERWHKLKHELMHVNRYFPDSDFDSDRLEFLLSNLILDQHPEQWFRARREKGHETIALEKMGAPPEKLASHGRANPAGIPYLYLASTKETAIAEVRPHPGERVCVATFSLGHETKIVDLRQPRTRISPFLLEDEGEIALMRGDIEFLEILGKELATPVVPTETATSYIPSQFLCEFIKKCGFDGVAYGSAISGGMNLALFRSELANPESIDEFDVTGMKVEYTAVE